MLENTTLLLLPWMHVPDAGDGPAWIRRITEASGAPLGFVRLDGEPRTSWLSWFRKIRLDVFETEDASHVMSLTRFWGVLSSWEIEDAESRHVGNLYAKTLVSSDNERLGYLEPQTFDQGRVLDPSGNVMACFAPKSETVVEVVFPTAAPANPFLRMLVLGSILTLMPTPRVEG